MEKKTGNRRKAATKTGSVTDKPEINLVQTETDIIQEKRKRGRPKGSKNKTIRKDYDIAAQQEPGENSKLLKHEIKLYNLPSVNVNDLQSVKDRISLYFSYCEIDDVKPSIASLALSFGISRFTLFNWLNGKSGTIKNIECLNTIKTAYNIINAHYENMMNQGKINPIAAIFLMKNNMGYKDVTDYIISTDNNNNPTTQDILERAGLLTDE